MNYKMESEVAANILTITPNGRELVRIGIDGKITYGEGYTPDAAAKCFWEALVGFAPAMVKAQAEEIVRLRAELESLHGDHGES